MMTTRLRRPALFALLLATTTVSAQDLIEEMAWAYAISPPAAAPATAAGPDDDRLYSLPDSARTFRLDQIRDRQGPADWYPGDHPAMPPVVAHGRESAAIWACSLCHYPNGKGRPENAGVAGLTPEYFLQQLHDFRAGLRTSADTRKANTGFMISYAASMTDDEMQAAAEYFSSMRWSPWIEVVETETVPKTRVQGGMYLVLDGPAAGTEPLGRRIIETPRDAERTERLRDPRSDFIAYVPIGAVARGEALAAGADGDRVACGTCHGETLSGLAFVPGLRGRSPSYIARQLVDFKLGTRRGSWSPLMAGVVADLSGDDIVNLAAYLASLPPD